MRFLLAALVIFSAHGAAASTGSHVKELMNQPASLFDIGMQRLPSNADQFGRFYRSASNDENASLSLNWQFQKESNQIIGSMNIFDKNSDEKAMRAGCEYVLNQMRIWVSKSLPKAFMHQGWDWDDSTDKTKALDKELRSMFVFSCRVIDHSQSRFTRVWTFSDPKMIVEEN